jgi:hypothetical protein
MSAAPDHQGRRRAQSASGSSAGLCRSDRRRRQRLISALAFAGRTDKPNPQGSIRTRSLLVAVDPSPTKFELVEVAGISSWERKQALLDG